MHFNNISVGLSIICKFKKRIKNKSLSQTSSHLGAPGGGAHYGGEFHSHVHSLVWKAVLKHYRGSRGGLPQAYRYEEMKTFRIQRLLIKS